VRLTRRAAALSAAALILSPAVSSAASPVSTVLPSGETSADSGARFSPWLEKHLTEVAADTPLRVMVRGTSIDAAVAATEAAGLQVQQRWELVDIAVGIGTPAEVRALRGQPGAVYVEGDTPLSYSLETAHEATRSNEALATYTDAAGNRVDGAGVSIAVIDSGVDGTHPMFQQDGESKVVVNRKNVCGFRFINGTNNTCFQTVPDTDTISAGGHGTHVAGIAGGAEITTILPAGKELRGSAPGAKLVSLSVGASLVLIDAVAAQNWVLEHQQNPCRSAAEQTESEIDADCPPIRVTNHSYGPAADGENGNSFNEDSAAVQVQRALVDKGVVAVWAAGNSGGDGSLAFTNPTGMDPTPGIVMVASYNDANTGDRDNELSGFSSRGKDGEPGTYPDLSAPGHRITSACRAYLTVCSTGRDPIDGGNYNTISGTSMAAPYVAGVVAQLFQADPTLTPGEAEDILEDSAHKFTAGAAYESDPRNTDDTTSFDKGHGLVDVFEALALISGGKTAGSEPTCTKRGKSDVCSTKGGGKPDKS
jgi:subtilisin family serine protease